MTQLKTLQKGCYPHDCSVEEKLWRGSGTCLLAAFTHVQYTYSTLFCVIYSQICDASVLFAHAQENKNLSFRNKRKRSKFLAVALDISTNSGKKCICQIFCLQTSIISDFFPLRQFYFVLVKNYFERWQKIVHNITSVSRQM